MTGAMNSLAIPVPRSQARARSGSRRSTRILACSGPGSRRR